jgi:tetratricopeptide (TPR) repeat protein
MKIAGVISSFAFALVIAAAGADSAPEPLFEGLGSHTRKISTNSPEAQKYFDQGFDFLFGFNHGAAIRAFQAAEKADPTCAMAHWGIALACGPHINFPHVPPSAAELAWKELVLAQENVSHASAVENALTEALGHRYANPQPEDRSPLDRAYADAMRGVWKMHAEDPDIGALFAEAMMDLRPWDQWTPDGQPQPGTEEILTTLEAVLKLDVNHPLANHLYIHAVDASSHPEWADAAADRLRQLQPGLAHNVHMPSHIDIRRGRWQKAIDENLRAIAADAHYRMVFGPPEGLLIVYAAHNQHMLAYAAMMTGQSELAFQHIRAMVEGIPLDYVKEHAAVAESLVGLPYEVLIRFGRWDEILAAPDHPGFMPLTRAIRFAARGIALAAKGDVVGAKIEQEAYLAAAALVPPEETVGSDTRRAILPLVTPMLAGEILYREGKCDEGLAKLREAVKAEDALRYSEPPDWILPARHSLGAALMQERRFAEAEQVYRDDLARLPENGWSLFGLAQSLHRQGKEEEAVATDARFHKIWSKADVQIKSSCLCQPGV